METVNIEFLNLSVSSHFLLTSRGESYSPQSHSRVALSLQVVLAEIATNNCSRVVFTCPLFLIAFCPKMSDTRKHEIPTR